MNAMELIRNRKSVRTYNGEPLREADRTKILANAAKAENPYGIPIEFRILDAKADHLSSPVISGTDAWITGKMKRVPHAEEAFGYSFEKLLLSAVEMGLGTVWIAGTMDRKAFETAMDLQKDEVLPSVSPLGYPSAKKSLRENMMRLGIKADSRQPFSSLFFAGNFSAPLDPAGAGIFADPLEMVRWAPSAVNKQPWRVVIDGEQAHFYEKRGRGYRDASGWDIQKIDLGIAMYHFRLGMESLGKETAFRFEDPGIPCPEDTEYIGTWRVMPE